MEECLLDLEIGRSLINFVRAVKMKPWSPGGSEMSEWGVKWMPS